MPKKDVDAIYVIPTRCGAIGVRASGKGINAIALPGKKETGPSEETSRDAGDKSLKAIRRVARLRNSLKKYLDGMEVDFKRFDVCWDRYGAFDKRVLRACRNIPYGEVASYAEIAERIGSPKASRAVGNALGRNRTPIVVPCHRVIRKDGRIGGFSSGQRWKKRLLRMEGSIKKHGIIR